MVKPFFLHTLKIGDSMKKKVGILLRLDETYHLNKELVKWLEEHQMIPIGIVSDKLEDMIEITNLCDGIILQGGSNYTEIELEYVRYLYKENISTFGICLGMQMMAVALNGSLETLKFKHHQNKGLYVHEVNVLKNTKLYDIVKSDTFNVNSRHNDYVKYTSLVASGYSEDGVIEAVEDKNCKFFLGVQWHPESIKDMYSERILEAFIKSL